MKIGIFQFNPEFGEIEKNLKQIASAAASQPMDILVLPELCTTGYHFISHEEVHALAESVEDGRTVNFLTELSGKYNLHIVAGIIEQDGGDYYNSSVFIGPEGLAGLYRKVHLFWNEKKWFKPGNLGYPVWDIGQAKVGMMICFDWMYPEAARSLTLKGAEIILHPANLVLPYCQDAAVTRSLENRVFMATANRTGEEFRDGKVRLTFTGGSQITDPKGNRILTFNQEENGCKVVEIDPAMARDKKLLPTNDLLEDRRTEQYFLN